MANLSNINNKFLVTTGGNVGIEVTGPTKKLDVYQSSTGFGVADFRHVNGNRILVNPSYNYYDAYNHIFRGLNGTDTHLTISNTGKATFGGDVSVTGGDLTLGTDSIASNINGVGDVLNINVDSNTGGGAGANIQLKTAGTTQLTINNSSSTFAGDIHLTDGKILGLRTSTNDYAIQYRDLDFRFIGSADGTTQRKFSFGYYTSDNPAGTWNGKVYINSYSGRVGIGTNNPVKKIDVIDTVNGAYSSSTQQAVARFFNKTNDGTINSAFVNLQCSSDNEGSNPVASIGVVSEGTSTNNGSFVVSTRNSSGITEKMRIDSGGLVSFPTTGLNDTRHIILTGTQGTVNNAANLGMWGDEVRLTGNWYYNGAHQKSEAGNGMGVIGIGTGTTDAACFLAFGINGPSATGGPTERMRISSSGTVAIGFAPGHVAVTSLELPANTSNSSLKVGGLEMQSYSINNGWYAENLYYNGGWKLRSAGYATQMYMETGSIRFKRVASAGGAGAAVSPVTTMILDTTGKVGIGEDTPTAKLHLAVDSANDDTFHIFNGSVRTHLLASESTNGVIYMRSSANTNTVRINASGDSYFNGGKVGIGITSLDAKLQVSGSISSGTGTAPTQISYDSNGNVNAFTHNFSEVKNTPSARNVTFVNVSGLGNFHQSFFYVQYGTRLQGVSDSTTGVVIRTYGVNRFNGGTLQVTETNAIAGSSNSLTHALVSVAIISNTEYRLIVEFSSTLGASSFVSGEIKGYGVGDSFPTITFAEGASAN